VSKNYYYTPLLKSYEICIKYVFKYMQFYMSLILHNSGMCELRYLHIFTLLSDISYGNRTIMVRLCISLYHFKMKPHERLSYGLVCNLLFGPA
jgi:hypothetical protein